MVLLAMTSALADVIRLYLERAGVNERDQHDEMSLIEPGEGKPISHAQIIRISKWLLSDHDTSRVSIVNQPKRLDELLKGCKIYQPQKERPKEQVGLVSGLC